MGIKRKIQIWLIFFVVSSILGYMYQPIVTFIVNILTIGIFYFWIKKKNIKVTFVKKKK
jgi:uncharacterized membrane-anchored protein